MTRRRLNFISCAVSRKYFVRALKASVYDGGANVGVGRLGILRKILKVSAHNGA
ncbi:hypothetical protein [uncultured Campylobacter sp.]|uniref:hypothetical protein n=1 Tax=uncultured Campylobacter sp. TaxID=218934 RepID=UPI00260593AB|nr:hypothetical protein [uncultured Campylobacter sp.]